MSQPEGGTGQGEPVPTGTLIGAVGRPGEDDRRKRVSDVSDIGAFLRLGVGKDEHHAAAVTCGREETRRQAAAQQRAEAPRGVRQAEGSSGSSIRGEQPSRRGNKQL